MFSEEVALSWIWEVFLLIQWLLQCVQVSNHLAGTAGPCAFCCARGPQPQLVASCLAFLLARAQPAAFRLSYLH